MQEQFQRMAHFMKYCQALRERQMTTQTMVLSRLGIKKEDILMQQAFAGMLKPSYVLVRDHQARCIVLAIRGTHSIKVHLIHRSRHSLSAWRLYPTEPWSIPPGEEILLLSVIVKAKLKLVSACYTTSMWTSLLQPILLVKTLSAVWSFVMQAVMSKEMTASKTLEIANSLRVACAFMCLVLPASYVADSFIHKIGFMRLILQSQGLGSAAGSIHQLDQCKQATPHVVRGWRHFGVQAILACLRQLAGSWSRLKTGWKKQWRSAQGIICKLWATPWVQAQLLC